MTSISSMQCFVAFCVLFWLSQKMIELSVHCFASFGFRPSSLSFGGAGVAKLHFLKCNSLLSKSQYDLEALVFPALFIGL